MRAAQLGLLAVLAACGGNGPSDDGAVALTDAPSGAAGTPINWTIRRSGSVISCAAASATQVQITATSDTGNVVREVYPCVLNPVMVPLPAGRWAVEADLLGSYPVSAPAKAVTVPVQVQVMFDFYL